MFVGVLQVELELEGPRNLKERRRIVNAIRDRVRGRFEAAVADVGRQETRELVLGVSVVSNDARHARDRLDAILEWLENHPDAAVVDSQTEIL